jgi:ABC-2 type transport system ATP-binding protein
VTITAVENSASGKSTSVRIDTAGDLAPMLGWIGTLGLSRMRIEPLGLRAIYDSVHHDSMEDPRSSFVAPRLTARAQAENEVAV